MTAIAALNGCSLRRAIKQLTRLTLCYGELVEARAGAWSPRLARASPHPGQYQASIELSRLAEDSQRLRRHRDAAPRLASGDIQTQPLPQDPYILPCAPHELGAARDLLDFHDRIVLTELNAACDNPLIDSARGELHHGGNFYGQHVAYAADALATVAIKLGVFAERAIARLTDERLNGSLPPFLTGGRPGLDSEQPDAAGAGPHLLGLPRRRPPARGRDPEPGQSDACGGRRHRWSTPGNAVSSLEALAGSRDNKTCSSGRGRIIGLDQPLQIVDVAPRT
jgi:hypothetical protein